MTNYTEAAAKIAGLADFLPKDASGKLMPEVLHALERFALKCQNTRSSKYALSMQMVEQALPATVTDLERSLPLSKRAIVWALAGLINRDRAYIWHRSDIGIIYKAGRPTNDGEEWAVCGVTPKAVLKHSRFGISIPKLREKWGIGSASARKILKRMEADGLIVASGMPGKLGEKVYFKIRRKKQ